MVSFFIIRTMVSFFNDLLLAKMFFVQIWIEPGGLIRFGPRPIMGPGLDEAGSFRRMAQLTQFTPADPKDHVAST